jgi:hypothetical protein
MASHRPTVVAFLHQGRHRSHDGRWHNSLRAARFHATVQPVLTATVNGGRVDIGWSWEGNAKFLDMCEIQVDRGDGKGWGPLAFDTTPNYTDNAAFPATLTRWKYRAIYHLNDAQVGQWSAEVSVTVGG